MSNLSVYAAAFLALLGNAWSQNASPDATWQKLRDGQPKPLHLTMTLEKDHFFQGERIDATLAFSDDDPKGPYALLNGANGPGAFFHAVDEQGHPLLDPLAWEAWGPQMINGFVSSHPIGPFTLTLPANENVRFDHPGIYQLYASAGLQVTTDPHGNAQATVVSDPVTVTIDPLPPEKEQQIIAAALAQIEPFGNGDGPHGATADGIATLKYLQTPAARAALVDLCARPNMLWYAGWGLEAAPDPAVEADRLLQAAKEGKLVLDAGGANFYGKLKAYRATQGRSPSDLPEAERNKAAIEFQKIWSAARDEITQAGLEGSKGNDPAHADALWSAFDTESSKRGMPGDPDVDGGAARRAVAEHQLELPDQDVHRLLENWSFFGSVDFLPLVERETRAHPDNAYALLALATLKPDEARPLVIANLQSPDSPLLKGGYAHPSLLAVPPLPLPELDDFFRAKLTASAQPPELLVPLLCAFGSPAVLPAVLAYSRRPIAGYSWGPEDQAHLYLYWVRCDPPAAVADFTHQLKPGDDQFWTFFNMGLITNWNDVALPLVRAAVQDARPEISGAAYDLLQRHGTDADLDALIDWLERQHAEAKKSAGPDMEAHALLTNPRWHLTAAQKKRLETLTSTPEAK